jgi:acyl-CoA reductase-like NAD-dependent aldehyde dehydrogenase
MNTIDAPLVDAEGNDNFKKGKLEHRFYNIVDAEKASPAKGLSVFDPTTETQRSAAPSVHRASLIGAIVDARNAFAGWGGTPFARRKAILASLLNKIEDHADELSALLATEQGSPLAQARWEIDLVSKAFGPALMQMELHEKEQDVGHMEHVTKRYIPIDDVGATNRWDLPVILSFGKVIPALLAGDTVVLRPSAFIQRTVLRISEYIRELFPPGVFNVVTGGHDLWPWITSHSGIDLITFTRSKSIGKPVSVSTADTLELGGEDSRVVADTNPEKTALFGRVALVPINCKPGRYGLACTLFEILSFQPMRMKTQVLVWSLARKASYSWKPCGNGIQGRLGQR